MISFSGKHTGHIFHVIYLIGFFFALQVAIPEYINSSFIGTHVGAQFVGIFYAIAALISIGLLVIAPRILNAVGNYRVLTSLAALQTVILFGLAQNPAFPTATILFLMFYALSPIIFFSLDVVLEANSSDEKTGGLRGGYITILNLAWVISPFIVSLILTNGDYWKVYAVSAGIMALVTGLIAVHFRGFKDPEYTHTPFWEAFRKIRTQKELRDILSLNTILQFFYSWMVIYTPIYLHNTVGFEWSEIGIMFSIMLIPFVLFEFPAGRLADKRYGEKGILSIGFTIMAISTIFLSFINGAEFVLWAAALFTTRVGAALVEVMNETYFFKHVDGKQTEVISFFRNTRPVAYLMSPLLGTAVLAFVPIKFIFVILGAVMCVGIYIALRMNNTKRVAPASHSEPPLMPTTVIQ